MAAAAWDLYEILIVVSCLLCECGPTLKPVNAADPDLRLPLTLPERTGVPSRTAPQAAQAALALLQRASTEFFKQSGCVGCHDQPITVAAYGVARGSGMPVDEAAAKQHLAMIDSENARAREFAVERVELGGATDPPAYVLFSMALAKVPADANTNAEVVYLAGAQHRDGTWRLEGLSRSPIQEGNIARTALAARALQVYAIPGLKPGFDARIARARDWLLTARADTNDDFAMWALASTGWARPMPGCAPSRKP